MPVRLFVGNLPYDATEAEIQAHFATAGAPSRIAIPLDRITGRPRGFAFLDFDDPDVANTVIRKLDAQPFKSRPLAVREARPREERPPMGGRPPGGDAGGPPRAAEAGGGDGPRRMRPPPSRRGKVERPSPKGPIPIRTTGRFYGDEEDETPDADLDFDNFATSAPETDTDDGDTPDTDVDFENFAIRARVAGTDEGDEQA